MYGNRTLSRTRSNRLPIPPRAIVLAMISGAFLTISFPPVNLSLLSWVALVPLYKSLEHRSRLQILQLGFIAGMVHYLTLVYWIIVVLSQYGGLNPVISAVPYFLLCMYLALYPAAFSLLAAPAVRSDLFMLLTGCYWVSLEYARMWFLTGFPWCLLGYSQYRQPHLIQIADLTGVYGVSFLIVIVNSLIYRLLFRDPTITIKKAKKRFLFGEALIIVLLAGLTFGYGHYRLRAGQGADHSSKTVRAAVIQGNIDQSVKWDPEYQVRTLKTYQRLTRSTSGFAPDLIVWPETAVPFFFQDNPTLSPEVISTAIECNCDLVFGSPAYKRDQGGVKYYNRAYLISAGRMQYYDKTHLVPFGEYVPLKKYLFFINRLVPAAGDFKSGEQTAPLTHGSRSLGILICFEAIFPDLARSHARLGANMLVNITNDAWFGRTSAPYQHISMAVFRCIENRLPMIRAANTGFSAFIDPHGTLLEQSGLFQEQVLKRAFPISDSLPTFYTRYGDLFAFVAIAITLLAIIFRFIYAKRPKPTD